MRNLPVVFLFVACCVSAPDLPSDTEVLRIRQSLLQSLGGYGTLHGFKAVTLKRSAEKNVFDVQVSISLPRVPPDPFLVFQLSGYAWAGIQQILPEPIYGKAGRTLNAKLIAHTSPGGQRVNFMKAFAVPTTAEISLDSLLNSKQCRELPPFMYGEIACAGDLCGYNLLSSQILACGPGHNPSAVLLYHPLVSVRQDCSATRVKPIGPVTGSYTYVEHHRPGHERAEMRFEKIPLAVVTCKPM